MDADYDLNHEASIGYDISDIEERRRALLAQLCMGQSTQPNTESRPKVPRASSVGSWEGFKAFQEEQVDLGGNDDREDHGEDLLFKIRAAAEEHEAAEEGATSQQEEVRASGPITHQPLAESPPQPQHQPQSSLLSRLISAPPPSSSQQRPSTANPMSRAAHPAGPHTTSKPAPQREHRQQQQGHRGGRKQPVSLLYSSSARDQSAGHGSTSKVQKQSASNPHSMVINHLLAPPPASQSIKRESSHDPIHSPLSINLIGNPLQHLLGIGSGGKVDPGRSNNAAGSTSLLYKRPRLSHESIAVSPPFVPKPHPNLASSSAAVNEEQDHEQGNQGEGNHPGDVLEYMKQQEERHRSILSILPRQSLLSEPGLKGFGALGRCLSNRSGAETTTIKHITPSSASLTSRLQQLLQMQSAHQDRLDKLVAAGALSSSLVQSRPAAPIATSGADGGLGGEGRRAADLNHDCFLNLSMVSGSGSTEGHLFKCRARGERGGGEVMVMVTMTSKMATALKLQEGALDFTVHRPWGEIVGGAQGKAGSHPLAISTLLVHAATPNWVV